MYQLVKRLGYESVCTCAVPFGALAFMSLLPSTLNANSSSAQSDMSARINEALQTQTESGFEFGSIVPSNDGTNSTLNLSADGQRDCPTALVCSGEVTAASLTVQGTPLTPVAFSYPEATTLRSGINTLQVSNIHDSEGGVCGLDAAGRCVASFGASIDVMPNQPIGAYSGTLDVQVDYN